MPFVQFKAVGGVMTPKQKTALIAKLTDAVVDVYGEGIRSATWVGIEEFPTGAWGSAGKTVTADDVKRLIADPPDRLAQA